MQGCIVGHNDNEGEGSVLQDRKQSTSINVNAIVHVNGVDTHTCSISYEHSPEHEQHHAAAGVGQDAVGRHVGSHPAECRESSHCAENVWMVTMRNSRYKRLGWHPSWPQSM